MKSLVESLFDVEKNITKDITFGDLFELTDTNLHLNKPSAGWKSSGRGWRQGGSKYLLRDLYDYKLIEKDSKVKSDGSNDDIIKGIIKLIKDFQIKSDTDQKSLNSLLKEFQKYYKPLVNNTRTLRARSFPYVYNMSANGIKNMHDWKLLDVEAVKIELCCIEINFKRK